MAQGAGRVLGCAVLLGEAVVLTAGFLTSHAQVKSFSWTAPSRSFGVAVGEANMHTPPELFKVPAFEEGRPGTSADIADFVSWVDTQLLGGPDPFRDFGGKVPVPWPEAWESDDDQVGFGHFVAYTRRELCFIVAKSMTGAGTAGYANGLQRFLDKDGSGGCVPRLGDFGRSLSAFLQTCYADPALADGGAGPMLLVAKASRSPSVDEVRRVGAVPLAGAGLRVCQYDDGAESLADGLTAVPPEGCAQPNASSTGRDFMTGGLKGQAVQDISASFLGGYIFGNACGLGGGQDERLMTYMPEVAALTFFLSQHWQFPQLRQPAWILGARMLCKGLDGTARFDFRLANVTQAPITSDLVEVKLKGAAYNVSGSRPFAAFMSENQGFFNWRNRWDEAPLARRNKLPSQRDVGRGSWHAFEQQVKAWYRSVALTSYSEDVRPALKTLVSSLGTGPWLSGLWWGDSQLGFLAVWLGHALAAPTWGEGAAPFPVDYYIYSAFTENPGNQCYVHAKAGCQACITRCMTNPLPDTAYWMPEEAFFSKLSCVPYPHECGENGIKEVVKAFAGRSANELWGEIEGRLGAAGGDTSRTVFDVLLGSRKVAADTNFVLP